MDNILTSVLFNSFWILGLSLLLASLSYHHYQAQRSERSLREQLSTRSFLLSAWSSAALVGVGLAATSTRLWETVIWIAFTLYSIVNAVGVWRASSNSSPDTLPSGSENISGRS